MLSRVAERVYWMGRYLERVENSARLVAVYSEMLLDLPEEAGLNWSVPISILGMDEIYRTAGKGENALGFLLTNQQNIASMLSSLNFARENARTTRDIVPSEAWQAINELHLYAVAELPSIARRPNAAVPSEVVGRCHEVTGILEGTLSHGAAYQFVRLGRSLERADMISRMIDVAAATLMSGRAEMHLYESTVWRAVLRSLSAYQMYSQHVRRRVLGPEVLSFLLHNREFPRSIAHCIGVLKQALEALPRNDAALDQLGSTQYLLNLIDLHRADHHRVHLFVDELQLEFAALHGVIFETWLNPVHVT